MTADRNTAIVVGVLFIVATAAPIMSFPFLQHLQAPDYLTDISANATDVTIGVLLELIMALAIAGIAITIYPVLRTHNETLALGYVAARLMESVIFVVVAVIVLLSLLTLSREFVDAGSPDGSSFETLGGILRTAHDWSYVVGGKIVFTISALILNSVLYQSRLVPRFISVWGLLGAALLLAGGLLSMFGLLTDTSVLGTFVFLPIAVQEMVFAVWLIVKGFNPSAVAVPAERGLE